MRALEFMLQFWGEILAFRDFQKAAEKMLSFHFVMVIILLYSFWYNAKVFLSLPEKQMSLFETNLVWVELQMYVNVTWEVHFRDWTSVFYAYHCIHTYRSKISSIPNTFKKDISLELSNGRFLLQYYNMTWIY